LGYSTEPAKQTRLNIQVNNEMQAFLAVLLCFAKTFKKICVQEIQVQEIQ